MKNPEAVKKWVAALRSGEFKQGSKRLKDDDKYCCLGVACVLAKREGVIPDDASWEDECQKPCLSLREQFEAVKDWLGLQGPEGWMDDLPSLTVINDDGATFSKIADLIESEPKGLFKEGSPC